MAKRTLLQLRERAGLDLPTVKAKTGVGTGALWEAEHGKRGLPLSMARKLATVYGPEVLDLATDRLTNRVKAEADKAKQR